jgi:hypothetical protein
LPQKVKFFPKGADIYVEDHTGSPKCRNKRPGLFGRLFFLGGLRKFAITPSITHSGVEAPAVMPIFSFPFSQAEFKSLTVSSSSHIA